MNTSRFQNSIMSSSTCYFSMFVAYILHKEKCTDQKFTALRISMDISTVLFSMAAITKYHKLGGLKSRHLLSEGSGGIWDQRVSRVGSFWKLWGRTCLPSFSWFAGHLWCFWTCRCIAPISAFTFKGHSPHVYISMLKFSTHHIGLELTVNGFILTWWPLYEPTSK